MRHPAHWFGLGFGSGLSPKAPGTAGTLWAWGVFVVLQWLGLPLETLWILSVLSVPLGWWACTLSARHLGIADPGCVVWDEIAAFWLVLCAVQQVWSPASFSQGYWLWQVAAFVLFRFFDAVKPQPVRWADQAFKGDGWRGGWGIMLDDLVAAACTLVVLGAARWVAA